MTVPLPQLLDYPFAAPPAPGQAIELAPGLRWLRMPLPFALDHINLWLLDEDDGATLVDCGYADAPTRAQWETQLRDHARRPAAAADHRHPLPPRPRRQRRVAVGTLRRAGGR